MVLVEVRKRGPSQPDPSEAENNFYLEPHDVIFALHLPRMENLHAPTVPSGPTSAPLTNGTNTNGLSLAQLQAKKENIEAEIRALSSVLDSVCPLLFRRQYWTHCSI